MKNTLKTLLLSSILCAQVTITHALETFPVNEVIESLAQSTEATYQTAEQAADVGRELGECLLLLGKCTAHWTLKTLPETVAQYWSTVSMEKSAQDASEIARITAELATSKATLVATEAARIKAVAAATIAGNLVKEKSALIENLTTQLSTMTENYHQTLAQAASPTVVFKAICNWAENNPKTAAITAATIGLTLAVGATSIYNNCAKFIKGGLAAVKGDTGSTWVTKETKRIDCLTYKK